jgi:hypothetical protein
MRFSVSTNFPEVKKWLEDQRKQVQFAIAVSLTKTAQDVKVELRKEMSNVFDRPTPYTLNSLFIKPATRTTLESVVWIKDELAGSGTPAAKYLLPQIDGGKRSLKRFERALQMAGAMPPGMFAVPGKFARIDAYGNVSAGQIIQILSQLRITLTAGSDRNVSLDAKKRADAQRRAGGQYFALPAGRGKLLPGIYQARDFAFGRGAPRPIFIFVRSVTYKRRFLFDQVATTVAADRFPVHFQEELPRALASAP